jgi:hypothetical protein
MVIDAYVIDIVRAFAARYFSAVVKRVNAKEIKVPGMDALVSPE